MDKTAQELASKGRYGDSMLVHMAPEEVAGIASLGGVSMNPETGLPEMFKFKDFMKFAAPIALSVAMPAFGAQAAAGAGLGTAATASGAGTGLAGFLSGTAGKAVLSGLGSGLGSLLTGSNRDEALSSGMTAGRPLCRHTAYLIRYIRQRPLSWPPPPRSPLYHCPAARAPYSSASSLAASGYHSPSVRPQPPGPVRHCCITALPVAILPGSCSPGRFPQF